MLQQLQIDFTAASMHFGLSPAARAVAWESARAKPERAAACYRAIANSLSIPDAPGGPKARRGVTRG
jgi:hypothetical protein